MENITYNEKLQTNSVKIKKYLISIAHDKSTVNNRLWRNIEIYFRPIGLKFGCSPKVILESTDSSNEVIIKIPRIGDEVLIISMARSHNITQDNRIFQRTGLVSLIFNQSIILIDTPCLPNSGGSLITSPDMQVFYGILLPCTVNKQFEIGLMFNFIFPEITEMTEISRIQSVFPSVVKVYARMMGSGIVIEPKLIVTNAHVAARSDSIGLQNLRKNFPGTLRSFCKNIDLAFIETDETLSPVKRADDFIYGETVYAVGFGLFDPTDLEYPMVTIGTLSKVVRYNGKPVAIQFTAQSYNGHSGGGVFNARGELIGIIVSNARERAGSIIPTLSLCIPHSVFNDPELLDNSDPIITDIFSYETVRILPEPKL